MSARNPSPGASRHLLPQGEKEQSGAVRPLSQGRRNYFLPLLPLREKVARAKRVTDEGAAGRTQRFAKQLRKDMTDAEKKLWYALRDRRFENFKFRRQVPIGKYIADFVCQDCKLIVEVDGSQHEGSEHDKERDAWLTYIGYRVLRFWNIDTFKALDGTLLAILDALNETPHPSRGFARDTFSLKGRRQEK